MSTNKKEAKVTFDHRDIYFQELLWNCTFMETALQFSGREYFGGFSDVVTLSSC